MTTKAIREALEMCAELLNGVEEFSDDRAKLTRAMAELESIETMLADAQQPKIALRFSPNPPVTFKRTK